MIGYFPYWMIRDSPVGSKHFHRDGRARTDCLSNENYRFVNKSHRLEDIFTLESGDAHSGIISLMRMLLVIDPNKRYEYFDSLRILSDDNHCLYRSSAAHALTSEFFQSA